MPPAVAASRRTALLVPGLALGLVLAVAAPLGAQSSDGPAASGGRSVASPLPLAVDAPTGVTAVHALHLVAVERSEVVAGSLGTVRGIVPARMEAVESRAAARSRARGARYGFLIGAAVGVAAGLAISGDFYNDTGVNVAVGVGTFGLLGSLIGFAVGARAS